MSAKFDDILTQLGTGRWNILYFVVISYAFMIIVPHVFSGPFVSPPLAHVCTEPALPSFPRAPDKDQCEVKLFEGDLATIKCTAWHYDNTTFTSTLTSEYDLVCDQALLRVIYQSIVTMGNLIGDPLGGVVFDTYGRRYPSQVSFALFSAVSLGSCWLPSLSSLLVSRFLLGVLSPLAIHGLYTFAMEVCEPKYRSLVGIAVAIPFALGVMAWGGLAYLIRDWRWLLFVASLPTFPLLVLLMFLDESPRWLVIKGRHEEAFTVLEKVARWNGTTLPPRKKLLDDMREIASENEGPMRDPEDTASEERRGKLARMFDSIAILFRTPEQRKITLVLHLSFLCVVIVYGGLSIAGMIFDMNTFLYMTFTGLMELPGYTLTVPIIARFGRKYPLLIGYWTCAISLCIVPFIPSGLTWLTITFLMVGKLFISGVFQILFLYSIELLPTEVRARGIGTSHFASGIGSMLIPYIIDDLGTTYQWLPSVIFGILSMAAALATMLLPETLNRPLFETVAALEHEKNMKGLRQVYYKHPGTVLIAPNDQNMSPNTCEPKSMNTSQGDVQGDELQELQS